LGGRRYHSVGRAATTCLRTCARARKNRWEREAAAAAENWAGGSV